MLNNRLDRILYIQQVLVQGGVLNKQQTADRFGVSEKTIQRDLDTLRNHFADSEPRREILYNSAKGGYLLDDTLSRFLTSSEILAVCKILLESRSMVKEEMFPILDKLILACTPLDRLNQVKDLISNERFHYVEPQHGRKFIESLWEIGTAVENHNLLEITYCRTHDGETRVRTIEPVGILFSEYYFYLAAFIEEYIHKGAMHVQFNIMSAATMRAAQKKPEDYKDMLVRVAGYSAYFVELGKPLQKDLIQRTELHF